MKNTTAQALAAIAVSAFFSATAAAQCGVPKALQARPASSQASSQATAQVKAAAWPEIGSLGAPAQAASSGKGSITGLWLTTFYSGGQVVDQGFDIWHDDGTEILNDTPPPATGNVCLGVWEKNGHKYLLKHPSWTFDANGNLNGTAIIREKVEVLPGANNFAGTFTVDVYDLAGKLLLHLEGTVVANRITPD